MKLDYRDINWSAPGVKKQRVEAGLRGTWIVCVMDGEVVLNLVLDAEFGDILLSATAFKEVSTTDGSFCVEITPKTGEKIELTCDEMMQAVLVSNPTLVKIDPEIHKYYHSLTFGWHYVNGDFIIPGEME